MAFLNAWRKEGYKRAYTYFHTRSSQSKEEQCIADYIPREFSCQAGRVNVSIFHQAPKEENSFGPVRAT